MTDILEKLITILILQKKFVSQNLVKMHFLAF